MEVEESRRRRRRLTLILTPIALLVVATNVGNALYPTLVTEHPLWLLALNARNSTLVAVANQLDAVPYYVVGALRLVVSDPLFYVLGYWYGETALTWVEARSGSAGSFLRTAERFFAKAAYPLVVLAPNNYICLFAGASRMPPVAFVTLNLVGTAARLALFRLVGDVFGGTVDTVLDFVREHRVPLTVATVVLVVVQVVWDRRRGTGDLEALAELESALEHEPPEGPPERR